MRYCKQCKVNIADQTDICPLCHSVVENRTDNVQEEEMNYPMVNIRRKGYKTVLRICAFVCLVAVIILAIINYVTYNGLMWSIICDAGILYLLLTLRFTLFNPQEGHPMKILMHVIAIMILTVLIDVTIGFQGWSIIYAIPTILLVADTLIIILMIVNLKNWQNYILLQIGVTVLSAILGIGVLVFRLDNTLLTWCAIGVSAILFLGIVCVGDSRAINEIKRRFHV